MFAWLLWYVPTAAVALCVDLRQHCPVLREHIARCVRVGTVLAFRARRCLVHAHDRPSVPSAVIVCVPAKTLEIMECLAALPLLTIYACRIVLEPPPRGARHRWPVLECTCNFETSGELGDDEASVCVTTRSYLQAHRAGLAGDTPVTLLARPDAATTVEHRTVAELCDPQPS